MIFNTVIGTLLLLLNVSIAAAKSPSLFGKIDGFPSEYLDAQKEAQGKPSRVLNGINYQSRIKASLIPIKTNKEFKVFDAPLNRNFEFSFDQLVPGSEYQLLVSSYDFKLNPERFRVIVDDEGVVRAYQELLHKESYNVTSEKVVGSSTTPLSIKVGSVKEYYEVKSGSLWDMVLNSPFGFIFANTMYTIIFGVCCSIMAAPYILSWVAPDFASEFEEVRTGKPVPQQGAPPAEAIGSSGGSSTGSTAGRAIHNARQRK
ncbi:hypothetical protein CLIB1423_19S00232 [[Candida] railenensis]|uniref:ER membrane protein complex subunit 7 beta-sandwich domain-containing protein n=1 Tax=[Candida] railenensis TaxID=45579 RepID=A0A9P0W099_9ASCO|nr:hypothetical protein CLIB1423_19S00232 [[Candida] railenensis]